MLVVLLFPSSKNSVSYKSPSSDMYIKIKIGAATLMHDLAIAEPWLPNHIAN